MKENSSQKYICGDKVTIADFAFFGCARQFIFGEGAVSDALKPLLDANPVLKSYLENLCNKEFEEYKATAATFKKK